MTERQKITPEIVLKAFNAILNRNPHGIYRLVTHCEMDEEQACVIAAAINKEMQ